jgi:hypothetical protein
MPQNDLLIDPVAYLKIVMHLKRFNNETLPEEKRQQIYGVLVGYVDEKENIRHVINYIPLLHSPLELDFEKKHSVFMKIEKINKQLLEEQEPDYFVGWVRSTSKEEIAITDTDKKNQLYLQTAYEKDAVLIIVSIPSLEYDNGIEVKGYVDKIFTLDNSSILADLNWDFDDTADIDSLFTLLKDIHKIKGTKLPIIKEFGEISIGASKLS